MDCNLYFGNLTFEKKIIQNYLKNYNTVINNYVRELLNDKENKERTIKERSNILLSINNNLNILKSDFKKKKKNTKMN